MLARLLSRLAPSFPTPLLTRADLAAVLAQVSPPRRLQHAALADLAMRAHSEAMLNLARPTVRSLS